MDKSYSSAQTPEQSPAGRRRICVFCGTRLGRRPAYQQAAAALGAGLAQRGLGLVYGGAEGGSMGVVARAALEAGGEVTGILVQEHYAGPVFGGRVALEVVKTPHQRMYRMARLADGFIMLPGGLGTLEEFFEMLTWAQVRLQTKPIGVLNVGGYYDELLAFLEKLAGEDFMAAADCGLWFTAGEAETLLSEMADRLGYTI